MEEGEDAGDILKNIYTFTVKINRIPLFLNSTLNISPRRVHVVKLRFEREMCEAEQLQRGTVLHKCDSRAH